jgi:hypothetical protein
VGTNLTARTTSHGDLDCPQYGYARLFDRLEALRPARPVTVVDGGFPNDAGFKAYNPVLKFYALRETTRGLGLEVRVSDERLAPGQLVASCDPSALQDLRDDYRLATRLTERACVLAEVISEK